jgi:hypothetical protein
MKATSKLLFWMGLLLSLNTQAQLLKTTWIVGGEGSFNSSKTTQTGIGDRVLNSYSIGTRSGYFILNNLAVGLDGSVSHTIGKQDGIKTINSRTGMISPFVRYYYKKFFVETQYGWGSSKTTSTAYPGQPATILKQKTSNFHVKLGRAFFLNEFVALEPAVLYRTTRSQYESGSTSTTNISNFAFSLALQFYLRKKPNS